MGRLLEWQVDPVPLVIISRQHGYNLEGTFCNSSSCPPAKKSCFIVTTEPWWTSHTMGLIRLLYFCASCYNINVCATHIAGICNDIADSLSRFQMDKFRMLAPRSEVLPDCIPAWPTQIFMTTSCNAGIMALPNPLDKRTDQDSGSLSHFAASTPLPQPQHHP